MKTRRGREVTTSGGLEGGGKNSPSLAVGSLNDATRLAAARRASGFELSSGLLRAASSWAAAAAASSWAAAAAAAAAAQASAATLTSSSISSPEPVLVFMVSSAD